MNKKIIAIAIATAMAAPVAMADVTISGRFGGEFISGDNTRYMSDKGQSRINLDAKVGDAFAHMAWKAGLATGNLATPFVNRDLYAGYNISNTVNVRFGKVNSMAYAIEGDRWKGTFIQMSGTSIVGLNNAEELEIVQLQAKAGGALIKVDYDPTDKTLASSNEGYWGVSVKGKMGKVGYFAALSNGDGAEATPNKETSTKVGASMKFGPTTVTAMLTNEKNADGTKDSATYLTADTGLGKGLNVDFGFGTNKANDKQIRLAVSKNLNKGTKVYVGYTNEDKKTGTDTTNVGLGMIVKF